MKIFGAQIPFTTNNDSVHTPIDKLVQQVVDHPDNKEFKNMLAKAAKHDPVKVMTTIIRFQKTQYNKEILHWKTARQEAMSVYNPRRVTLTDLYEDIELDAFIYGIVSNKRIFKISNKAFKVIDKDGKEIPEKTAWFKHQWFNDLLKYAMQSRFFGYSLVYFMDWNKDGKIVTTQLVPRRHVVPERHAWTIMQYDTTGFDYKAPPFDKYMMGIGKEDDLGIYDKAAILYIIKKHSWQSWDEFEERFGIPIPIVETATQDKKVLDSIESWLKDLSTGSYGVIPEGGKLTVVETGKADTFNIFFKKIEMSQIELEVLLTGQIRETNKSGTYGKEQSKEEEAQELINDDKTFIQYLVNDVLIPQIMIPNGYQFLPGEKFDWNDGKKLSPKERLEILTGVKNLGFKLDLNQVSEDLDVIIEEAEPIEEPLGKEDENIKKISNMHVAINKLYNHV